MKLINHSELYSIPTINQRYVNSSKDWYVFFQFKYQGKTYKYKRREGINKIKDLQLREIAIKKLRNEIEFCLQHGWNPIIDPKRQKKYNPYLIKSNPYRKQPKPNNNDAMMRYYNK